MIAAMLSVICVVESAVADEEGSAAAELARLDALALADEYNEESLLLDATALDELVAAFVVVATEAFEEVVVATYALEEVEVLEVVAATAAAL